MEKKSGKYPATKATQTNVSRKFPAETYPPGNDSKPSFCFNTDRPVKGAHKLLSLFFQRSRKDATVWTEEPRQFWTPSSSGVQTSDRAWWSRGKATRLSGARQPEVVSTKVRMTTVVREVSAQKVTKCLCTGNHQTQHKKSQTSGSAC